MRTIGRYDLQVPDYVVQALKIDEILEPVLHRLDSIMQPRPFIRTHNIVFAPGLLIVTLVRLLLFHMVLAFGWLCCLSAC